MMEGLFLCLLLLALGRNGVGLVSSHASPSTHGPPGVVQREVFRAGEAGYFCFRIPALIFTVKRTLLAFSEGRGLQTRTCSDHGPDVRIVLKRSSDFGETWSDLTVVHSEAGHTIGGPIEYMSR